MSKYTIRVETDNPEFDVMEDPKDEIEVDGFLLLGIRDEKPYIEMMQGVSIEQLSKFFKLDTEAICIVRQAASIGEGYRKAVEIRREQQRRMIADKHAEDLAKALMGIGANDDGDAAGQ